MRVFGSKPGAYGAGLQGLIDERCWQTKQDLATAFINWGGYAYGYQSVIAQADGSYSGHSRVLSDGLPAKDAFEQRLSRIDMVLHNQDNREHDILDSDDYYQFQGGLANAVKHYSSNDPIIYHADHSNQDKQKFVL